MARSFPQSTSSVILTDGDGRHDEGVSVEQRRRLGADVATEVVQQQLLLLGESGGRLDDISLLVRHCSIGNCCIKIQNLNNYNLPSDRRRV